MMCEIKTEVHTQEKRLNFTNNWLINHEGNLSLVVGIMFPMTLLWKREPSYQTALTSYYVSDNHTLLAP